MGSFYNPGGSPGAGNGDMLKSENLAGLADYPTARSNLGALAPDGDGSGLSGVATLPVDIADTTGFGTAAAAATTDFLAPNGNGSSLTGVVDADAVHTSDIGTSVLAPNGDGSALTGIAPAAGGSPGELQWNNGDVLDGDSKITTDGNGNLSVNTLESGGNIATIALNLVNDNTVPLIRLGFQDVLGYPTANYDISRDVNTGILKFVGNQVGSIGFDFNGPVAATSFNYTPATSADWNGDPSTVGAAIDQLAARLAALEP